MNKTVNHFVFTGPESSGKTSLSKWTADNYNLTWIGEYARTYLATLDRKYHIADLSTIAKGQISKEVMHRTKTPLVCDTDLLTILIWAEERFNYTPRWIQEAWAHQSKRYYFVCRPDIPWEEDPQRENPHDRERLFEAYLDKLESHHYPYIIVEGEQSQRRAIVEKVMHASGN